MPRNYEVLANVLLSVDDFRFDRGNSDHKASVHSVSTKRKRTAVTTNTMLAVDFLFNR